MIFQLRHPIGILAIAVAVVVGVFVHDLAQVMVAQALGDPMPKRSGRLFAGFQPRVDPWGVVGVVLVGYGWPKEITMDDRWRARRKKVAISLAAGPVAYLALTFASAALLRAHSSSEQVLRFEYVLTYTFAALTILSIIPVPPLDGGRIMLVLAPQSIGWQKARYQLVDKNIGIIVALAVILIPLVSGIPSIVGNLAVDILNPIGSAVVGAGGLGDYIGGNLGVQ